MLNWLDNWLAAGRETRRSARHEEQKNHIAKMKILLRTTPTGAALIDFAESNRVLIAYSDDIPGRHARYRCRTVLLSTSSPRALMPLYLAHELRHAWQDANGLLIQKMTNAADAIINERFCEADAFTIEAQLAWELEQTGKVNNLWARYARNEKQIAGAFGAVARHVPDALENGCAARAAFNAWFKTPHKDRYDRKALKNIEAQCERIAQGGRAYPITDKARTAEQGERLSISFLREFGACANGVNYLANANTHAPLYTEHFARSTLFKIQRMARKYPHMKTAGVACTIPSR